ncbi:MAG: DUF3795 domain-containing protein [Candidatus Bathyarchaeota archaeon]|nr:DUF3795 domain-containing protein [Candidatus Bathyarchaeota archaeon]
MNQDLRNLAAPCGLFCGACSVYVAGKRGDTERLEQIAGRAAARRGRQVSLTDLACDGCLSDVTALYCGECALRHCVLERGWAHCAQCPDFPCSQISDFNDDGRPHHGEVLDNIRRLRDIGLDAWIEEQRGRWRCPTCGCAVEWYAGVCPDCDTPLSGHF